MLLVRTKSLVYSLSLFGLLGTVQGSIQVPVPECTVKAWVRAPDLAPNTIVQGDARVKISAGCPAVETVMLGLRLKERSFVKALRSEEERKQWSGMQFPWPFASNPLASSSPWDWPPAVRYMNDSDDIALRRGTLTNRNLWIVREEESVVFETTEHVPLAKRGAQGLDVVQDFAVLVPSTNFPPALDYSNTGPVLGRNQLEIADVESLYEYFFRVPFTNGTTTEISAGITSFQPLYNPADPHAKPSSMEAKLKRAPFPGPEEDFLTTNYTAQITGIPDSAFTLGSDFQVTVIVTRTGPARTFTLPLKIRGCVEPKISSKWAVEQDPEGSSDWTLRRPQRILRSTSQDIKEGNHKFLHVPGPMSCLFNYDNAVSIMMPSSTEDEIQLQDIVTTTSESVTIPITVDRRHIPDFETHYQILANALRIVIQTPRTRDEKIDPDDLSMQPPDNNRNRLAFEDDEEEWVPWETKGKPPVPPVWHTYSGSIPVAVRPTEEVTSSQDCLHADAVSDMRDQAVMSEETGCVGPRLTYYLDDGARGPIFVDPGALSEILAEDPVEREQRTPILQPVVSSPPKGEELVHRYCAPLRSSQLIYVGETWVRKVAHKQHL